MEKKDNSDEVFEWLQTERYESLGETTKEKFVRKIKENPLVPLGILLTTGCLSYGIYSFRIGNKRMSQLMMRGRVLAQGFTIAALVGGILLTTKTNLQDKK